MVMRPYGLIKRINYFVGKVDYHCHDKNHRKVDSWWADYEDYTPRSTMKLMLKREVASLDH